MGSSAGAIGFEDSLKWNTLPPKAPGFYWLAEQGEPLHIVQVDIVSDSNCRLEIIKGAGHDFAKPEQFEKMVELIAGFIADNSNL